MLDSQQLTLDVNVSDERVNTLKIKAVELPKFPTTRYQGSKRKILNELAAAVSTLEYTNVLDMFSGSGVVTLMFRVLGKNISSNDFMLYNQNTAKVFQEFDLEKLNALDIQGDLQNLLHELPIKGDKLVSQEYEGVFFLDSENEEIDRFCQNINDYDDFAKSVYIYAVGQALTKKRPYNLFHRANLEMRTKEVKRSFGNKKTWDTPTIEHAIKCINELKKFPIKEADQLRKQATRFNSADLDKFGDDFDLIYLDPPYINGRGTPVDYSDFYHFLEGLCDYSLFAKADGSYPHKPINKKTSAWLKANTALAELTAICDRWPQATIVFSYRSDGQPMPDEIAKAMSVNGRTSEIHTAGEYKYALSKTNTNEELVIISKPA
ncbi:DNA adenine methylase [Vibrio diabolicus]|uniref:DNA adenine methylase n=1 Tax=Vibrio diabolicus TaxID=50719 RepID=UPI001E099BDB|nr:DNA adenine methylase [Vibrio parahaemolyticus]EJG1091311.1 DNA adenine methylase [Vibrio parahaemolyticus]HCE1242913.1 DNA adenine methylase [Vibrio parahaemolyticus]HCG6226368.1 DNA adenine methylase [Vibrio parahaemolyticus]HCG6948101.1 DNA adenine methylase [Vibrio parahaemolyticus]